MSPSSPIPPEVLAAYRCFNELTELPLSQALKRLDTVTDGLINATWRFVPKEAPAVILQRLHPMFSAAVNEDIVALVPHLRRGGVPVPDVVATIDGDYSLTWTPAAGGELNDKALVWRVLTALPGRTIHRIEDLEQARCGGAAVARFHRALRGIAHDFAFTRPNAHNTDAHMAAAQDALSAYSDHRLVNRVAPLVQTLVQQWQQCPRVAGLSRRIIHGDLKISNLLFGQEHQVLGVVDLDTMAWGSLDVELGDMLRSWCNLGAEDAASAKLSPEVFEAAMTGYFGVAGETVTDAEARAIVPGLERICLELAARFAKDALAESYFGWSPKVAPTAGEHHLIRARNQLQLAASVASQRDALGAVVSRLRGL